MGFKRHDPEYIFKKKTAKNIQEAQIKESYVSAVV